MTGLVELLARVCGTLRGREHSQHARQIQSGVKMGNRCHKAPTAPENVLIADAATNEIPAIKIETSQPDHTKDEPNAAPLRQDAGFLRVPDRQKRSGSGQARGSPTRPTRQDTTDRPELLRESSFLVNESTADRTPRPDSENLEEPGGPGPAERGWTIMKPVPAIAKPARVDET